MNFCVLLFMILIWEDARYCLCCNLIKQEHRYNKEKVWNIYQHNITLFLPRHKAKVSQQCIMMLTSSLFYHNNSNNNTYVDVCSLLLMYFLFIKISLQMCKCYLVVPSVCLINQIIIISSQTLLVCWEWSIIETVLFY